MEWDGTGVIWKMMKKIMHWLLMKKANTSAESKEGVDGKLEGFLTASKDQDNLIESQRPDKNKEELRYNDVPHPPTQIYSSPKNDLSWTGLPEFADDTVTDYSRPSPTMESTSGDDQNRNPSVSKTDASPSTITSKPAIKFVKAAERPTTDKVEIAKKPAVKYAKQYIKPNKKPNVRGNQRNWNNLKSHQLGPNFVMHKKACFNYGDFNHLAYDCRKRVKKGTSRSQNNIYESFTPRPVVRRPYRPPVKPMRTNMNGARPNRTSFNKHAHSYPNRPFQRTSTGSSQNNINDKGYWDSGCSRHMTGNISYLSDYEPFDGGYVSFGQGGCKITCKGIIKTGKLEFGNVYFVKDLKYNLFSVSQICDNKNNVLFTDSECIVLERDFKLLDDANILLRTPRQHNMYSIDLNNIVPHKDLTCLVAKASTDECML
nr:ribonuclease H-like domain-containing protein [Tanacetum cinerariifolium]